MLIKVLQWWCMVDLATGLITVAVAVAEQEALPELQVLLKAGAQGGAGVAPIHLGYQ
jgi:hypothetical protein